MSQIWKYPHDFIDKKMIENYDVFYLQYTEQYKVSPIIFAKGKINDK